MRLLKYTILCFVLILLSINTNAQSYAFGLKGGMTLGSQNWENSFDSSALFRYHAIAFIETAPEDNTFAVFGQLGYHIKGSAIRTFGSTIVDGNGNRRTFRGLNTPFEFHNLSLTAGGKQKFDFNFVENSRVYYLFGIRLDYTLGTNFSDFDLEANPLYATIYPIDGFVNDFNYGATVGGGMEIPFGELTGLVLEFTVNPDFSKQYNQPQINNVINPNPDAIQRTITIPERSITNVTFEISLGIRFMNIIEYID